MEWMCAYCASRRQGRQRREVFNAEERRPGGEGRLVPEVEAQAEDWFHAFLLRAARPCLSCGASKNGQNCVMERCETRQCVAVGSARLGL